MAAGPPVRKEATPVLGEECWLLKERQEVRMTKSVILETYFDERAAKFC